MTNVGRGVCVLAVALLLPALAFAAAAERYRLSGVMSVGDEYLGILQLPDGSQLLVRKGSTLANGGQVLAIDAARVRLGFPGRTPLDVRLDGADAPAVASAGETGIGRETSDRAHVMVRSVDAAALDAGIARADWEMDRARAAAAAATSRPVARDAGAEAALALAPILELPKNSRITQINERKVRSADELYATVRETLAQGSAVRLTLAHDGREYRVYVTNPPRS
jgi:hypothetical protein